MPSFTIYVTGGAEWFYATLNAIAMFFNDGDFIWEVALMGALFAIITGAWFYIQRNIGSGLLKTHTWVEHAVMMALALAIGFVPTRVTIQDIYGDMSATPVDNVPLIFSLPAAIFSGVSYEIFRATDTTFSSTSGSYMSVSDQGFATPLKLLFAMRGGLEKTSGDLAASFQYYLVDCTRNSAVNARGVSTSPALFDYLITNGRDTGLTRTLIDPSGSPTGGTTSLSTPAPVSCAQAKTLLQQRFDVFETGAGAGGADVDRLINYNISSASNGATAGGAGYTYASYQDSFNHLLGFTGQSAQQFMRTALVRNIVNDTYRCVNAAYSEAAFTNCTQIQNDAMEAYKVDAAAGANLFTKTMFPAMTLLQLMFFAFGVIVFLYGLLKGAGVVTYLAKYFVFGLWVFSWLPFVAIINAFIQWMVEDKIQQLPSAGLTSENYATYMYDVLSTNLATASDMLAATPLLTLGILTGSAYAIAGVAGRMAARDYADESQAAPRTGTVQPMVQTTPMHVSNVKTGIQSSDYAPIEYKYDEMNGETIRSAERASEQKDFAMINSFMNAQSSTVTAHSGQSISNSESAGMDSSRQQMAKQMYSGIMQRAQSEGYSMEDANAAMAKVGANIGVDFSVPGVAKALSGVGGSVGADASASLTGSLKSAGVTQSNVNDLVLQARESGTAYALNNANGLRDTVSTLGGVTGAEARSSVAKFEQDLKEQQSAATVYENLSELSHRQGSGRTIGSPQLSAMIQRGDDGNGFDFTQSIHHKYQEYEQTYGVDTMRAQTARQLNYVTQGGSSNLYASDTMAQMEAMARMDQDGAAFKNEMVGVALGTGSVGADYNRNSDIAADARAMGSITDRVGGTGTGGLPRATGIRSNEAQIDRLVEIDSSNQANADGFFRGNEKLNEHMNRRGGTETLAGRQEATQATAMEQTRNVADYLGEGYEGPIGDAAAAVGVYQSNLITGRGMPGEDPSAISDPVMKDAQERRDHRNAINKERVEAEARGEAGPRYVDIEHGWDHPGIKTGGKGTASDKGEEK